MSYILDALQKSEAERRQEKLPEHLANERPLLYRSTKNRAFWPVFIVALLILNTLVLVYLYSLRDSGSQSSVAASGAVPALAEDIPDVTVTAEDAQKPAAVADPDRIQSGSAGASSIQDAKPGPLKESLNGSTSPAVADISQQSLEQDMAIGAESPKTLEQVRKMIRQQRETRASIGEISESRLSISESMPISTASPTLGNQLQSDSAIDNDSPLLITPSRRPASGVVSEPEALPESSVPDYDLISQLPDGFRRSLPALRFNSHIYSSEPASRRIMINDHYLREGQSFSGLKVVEITPDGVVLEKQGRTFLVSAARDWYPE